MSRRTEKLADLVQSTLADLIQRRLKDPALDGGLISLTRVEVAPDLATARVHVSVLSFGDGSDVDTRLREEGVIEALGRVDIASPIILRLDGTNAAEGTEMLRPHLSDKLRLAPDMVEAARMAVTAAAASGDPACREEPAP